MPYMYPYMYVLQAHTVGCTGSVPTRYGMTILITSHWNKVWPVRPRKKFVEKCGSPSTMALVAVKWNAPGTRYHGVVQRVKRNLIDAAEEGSNKVYVWWPRRGSRGKRWEGELVEEPSPKGK